MSLFENHLISNFDGSWASLRAADGQTEWFDKLPEVNSAEYLGSGGPDWLADSRELNLRRGFFRSPFLFSIPQDPLIGNRQRSVLSASGILTVTSLDPATGKEEWRSQPPERLSVAHNI